jgi:hypothetical protein
MTGVASQESQASILGISPNTIHYKFKNGKEFSVVNLNDSSIPLSDLKKIIIEEKKLRQNNIEFDLEVTNFQTNQSIHSFLLTLD